MNEGVSSGELFLNIVSSRRSMRDFKSEPVPRDIIESVFGGAQRAPSNCNTQPWFVHVVTGETLERLRAELPAKFAAGEIALDFPYDGQYEGVYKDRQYASATALYDSLGIAREQKDERNAWYTTLDDALAEAKRTNRPLLVQSAAPACHGVPGLW